MAYFYAFELMQNYGFNANEVLFNFCDALNIKVFKQPYQFYNSKNRTESVGLLVFIDDKKYKIKSLGFSDVCLDAFISGNVMSCNTLFIPLKQIDSLKIDIGDESFRFYPTERSGLFYSNNENNNDIVAFSDTFEIDKNEIIEAKNRDFLNKAQFINLLKNVSRVTGFDDSEIIKTNKHTKTKFLAYQDNEKSAREVLKERAFELLDMTIVKDEQNSTFDCATFVMFLFMSELGIDITRAGIGNSLTGKIMSSNPGEIFLIGENKSNQEKYDFVLKNSKVGDILLFHRQSKSSNMVEEDNWFPGHVGIYVGDGKYIDARHRRGDVQLVDMRDDAYMDCFIGFKNVVGAYFKELEKGQNEKC